jgi:hypothetical protein
MLPFSVMLLQQIHCYPIELFRYYGNAATHCYATGTVTLQWKCNMVHRSCYQGKPNMSQY